MATKPSDLPTWATSDVVDPTSGENNKVKPPSAWETNGWSYQEKPARNYDNWMKWNLSQWVNYLDASCSRMPTYKVAASGATEDSRNQADAVCDGTADNVEIQAGIDAVAAAGGGLLVLSEGIFSLSAGLTLNDNVHIMGMGVGATTLLIATGATATTSALTCATFSNVSLSGFSINGNKAARTSNDYGIQITSSSRIRLRDIEVYDIDSDSSRGDGVYIDSTCTEVDLRSVRCSGCEGEGFSIGSTGSTSDISYTGCVATGCVGNGFLNNGTSTTYTNCTVSSCGLSGFADAGTSSGARYTACEVILCGTDGIPAAGFDLGDGASATGCRSTSGESSGFRLSGDSITVSSCVSSGNDGSGFSIEGATAIVQGCISTGNDAHGIAMASTSSGAIVTGCQVIGNSQGTDDTSSGIIIASSGNLVTHNIVKRGALANAHKYGIEVNFGSSYVFGNDLVDSSKSGGTGGSIGGTASADTIPEWTGTSAGANSSDSMTTANRT